MGILQSDKMELKLNSFIYLGFFFIQPFVDRLPYRTPTRPKEIRLSPCDNNILTTSPDNGRLTTPVQEQGQPESPHVFLSPVDKGIFVINSTFDSSQVSKIVLS